MAWLFSAISNPWPPCRPLNQGHTVIASANAVVLREVQVAQQPRKRKRTHHLQLNKGLPSGNLLPSRETHAAAVKKFTADFEGGQFRESTVRLFKRRYSEKLKKAKLDKQKHINKNSTNLLRGQIFENRILFSNAYNCTFTVAI